MDPPDGCPDNIYDIMCHCWEMEPNERPDFPRLKDLLARTFGMMNITIIIYKHRRGREGGRGRERESVTVMFHRKFYWVYLKWRKGGV